MALDHKARNAGRLSDILKNEMGVSSGLMNRLKWDERILVNGIPQRTNYPVQAGDTVSLLLAEPEPEYPAQDMDLTILYEDNAILAADKPAGMLIHPSRSRDFDTFANGILGYYRRNGEKSAFHPLTRLDRDTFGVVIVAKNSHIHALLQGSDAQKTYHALVFGSPEVDCGMIDAPIARRPLPSLLRYVNQDGKPSQTEFTVLERNGSFTKLALRPITGRTHQLRVHCAHMGFPILGDPQYGSEASQALSAEMGLSSQLLCAKSLCFPHPVTGEEMELTSQLDV